MKPSDVSFASSGSWDGYCVPVCYIGDVDTGANGVDECYPASGTDITYAEFAADAAGWLDDKRNGCV